MVLTAYRPHVGNHVTMIALIAYMGHVISIGVTVEPRVPVESLAALLANTLIAGPALIPKSGQIGPVESNDV